MSQLTEDGTSSEATVVEQAQEKVQEAAQQARGAARRAVGTQLDQRSQQAAEQITEVTKAVRQAVHGLREEGKDAPANLLETVTERSERLAGYLQRSSSDTLLHDFEHFGRRNPWLVIAGGVAAGLAASRILKASSNRRFEELRARGYSSQYEQWPHVDVQPSATARPATPVPGELV